MHTNHRIAILIRASRLYCHSMYQEYEPKYYSTIKEVVLNFTNKLFGTKSIENKIDIKVLPLFEDNYIGVNIAMEFPDESGLRFELYTSNHLFRKKITTTSRDLYQLRPNK